MPSGLDAIVQLIQVVMLVLLVAMIANLRTRLDAIEKKLGG